MARLYDSPRRDVAGFETYAAQDGATVRLRPCRIAAMLEDILDGLFHIAKADGACCMSARAGSCTASPRSSGSSEAHYQSILARHVNLGAADPYVVLGIERGKPSTR